MLNELFSLGVTAEALRANIGSKSAISLQRWPVDPKFQVEGVAPTNHSFSQKTRLNDLSYRIKNLDRFFFRFVTIHAFDGQTDGRTTDRQTDNFLLTRPLCIQCSALKTKPKLSERNKSTKRFKNPRQMFAPDIFTA